MTPEQHNTFPRGRWSRPASPAITPTIKTVECFAPYANNGKGETRLVTYEALTNYKGFICPACAKPLWRIVGTSTIECLACGVNATDKTIEESFELLADVVYEEQLTERKRNSY